MDAVYRGGLNMDFKEHTNHCENACKFYRGWFIKKGYEVKKIEDPSHLGKNPYTSAVPIPFIMCACKSETKPFFIYQNNVTMIKILGCASFEEEWRSDDNKHRLEEIEKRKQKETINTGQKVPDVKESDTWTRINNREAPQSGQNVQQSVQIDGIRDLSIVNVDRLPESIHELTHPLKKRISDISIFKAEEFNAGDPFAQMKSGEVDEFYGRMKHHERRATG